ncbi:hypothetical protein F4818DRAFT_435658 [Hypoxylon cercidicola]|nr:hypothetical protein F4818DRAFT_435658 [Hypoxylon cercidicola]
MFQTTLMIKVMFPMTTQMIKTIKTMLEAPKIPTTQILKMPAFNRSQSIDHFWLRGQCVQYGSRLHAHPAVPTITPIRGTSALHGQGTATQNSMSGTCDTGFVFYSCGNGFRGYSSEPACDSGGCPDDATQPDDPAPTSTTRKTDMMLPQSRQLTSTFWTNFPGVRRLQQLLETPGSYTTLID